MNAADVPTIDFDVEAAVLGGVMQVDGGRETLVRLVAVVHETDFGTDTHGRIYARMVAMHGAGQAIDQISLVSALREHGELDAVGGPPKILQLFEAGLWAIPANVPTYIATLLEASRKRALRALGQRIDHAASNGTGSAAVLDDIAVTVDGLRQRAERQRPDEAPSEVTALLAHRFPPRQDVLGRGLLPRGGLIVLGGAPKIGKSLLLTNALISRAHGRAWLGFPTDPGVSLVVQSELRAEAEAERLRTMLRHDPEPFPEGRLHIKSRRGVMLDEPAGLAQIAGWIEETGADLLGVDPLARHMSGDENSNRDMGAVVRAIDSLIERYGVAVAIVHHPSKPKDSDPRTGGMRLRGASALFAAADTVVMMDRTDDGFVLTFEVRHGAAPEPMRLTRTEDLWLVPAGPDPELLKIARLTLAAPLTHGALTRAIQQHLQLAEATAKRRITATQATGLIEKNLDGAYQPTAAVSRYHGPPQPDVVEDRPVSPVSGGIKNA